MRLADPLGHRDGSDRPTRFETMYIANYELILGYALRRTQTREDAADVVAETFLTAWRRFDEIPQGTEARLWLFGVARMVLANHARGQRRYERLGARLRSEARPVERHPQIEVDEAGGMVSGAFRRLRANDQDILILAAVEGLTVSEIARVQGCAATAARVRLHRARTRFARELQRDGVDV